MADICIVTKTWRYSVASMVHSLTGAMVDAGVSVCLIAPRSDPESRELTSPLLKRIELQREMIGQEAAVDRKIATMRRIMGCLWSVLLERRQTRTFLITIPDPLVFSLGMFLYLRLSGARTIFLVHDAVPHAWKFTAQMRWLERAAHGLSYTLASQLIVMTPALKTALSNSFSIKPDKITVIPFGLPDVGPLPLHSPPGNGQLLIFGTLRRNKCIAEVIAGVIQARRQDPGVTLLIAGEPHPLERGYWDECLAATEQDPDGFDLRIGFVPDAELPSLISKVDAFVLAYRDFDSLSAVGILAAVCGRPVLCTAGGGLADLIDEGICHQVIEEPISAVNVAAAILTFRRRQFSDWQKEVQLSSEKFIEALSWKSIGQRYIDQILAAQAVPSAAILQEGVAV